MWKYYLTAAVLLTFIILMAMGITHYIELTEGREAAYAWGYITGPLAIVLAGLVMAALDGWRGRLMLERMFNRF